MHFFILWYLSILYEIIHIFGAANGLVLDKLPLESLIKSYVLAWVYPDPKRWQMDSNNTDNDIFFRGIFHWNMFIYL